MCIHPVWIPLREGGYSLSPDKGNILNDGRQNMGIYVGCGKCPECLKHRQNLWYVRFHHEKKYQDKLGNEPWFITLTYNDSNLPDDRQRTLKDWQAFCKQFERMFQKPRFYAVTEFGDRNNRVHWHALIFNVPRSVNHLDFTRFIEKNWHRGFVDCKIADEKQFRYVTKYITKDAQLAHGAYDPIQVFSKRPALGYDYARKYLGLYLNNEKVNRLHINGFCYGIPRLYNDKIIDEEVKFQRKLDLPEYDLPDEGYKRSVQRVYDKTIREAKRKKQINYAKLDLINAIKKTAQTVGNADNA